MTERNGMPLEGEGSYIGGKKFQDAQRRFAKSGQVPGKAREAAEALDGSEAAELEAARKRAAEGEIHLAGTPRKSFLDEALVNPEAVFASPGAILSYAGFSHDEKRLVLEAWQLTESQLLESSDEGMGQPQPHEASVVNTRASRLPEVQAALRKLDS